jgi:hypothetical protein
MDGDFDTIKHKSDYRTLNSPWENRGAYQQRPIMSVMFNCGASNPAGLTQIPFANASFSTYVLDGTQRGPDLGVAIRPRIG